MKRLRLKLFALIACPIILGLVLWPIARNHRKQANTHAIFVAFHRPDGRPQLSKLKHLLISGAYVNADQDPAMTCFTQGKSPIHYAAGYGCEFVRLFLEYGADVNAQAWDGDTALRRAATMGDIESVDLLLSRGANPNLLMDTRSAEKITVLSWTQILQRGSKGNLNYPRYTKIVQSLQKVGATE